MTALETTELSELCLHQSSARHVSRELPALSFEGSQEDRGQAESGSMLLPTCGSTEDWAA